MPVTTDSIKLNYITIAGPDKLTLSSFLQWSVNSLGNSFYSTGNMHNLMSPEAADAFVKSFQEKVKKGLITYYAKRVINNSEPEKVIPASLFEMSDIVLWFELYATEPKVLKTIDEDTSKAILEAWKSFLEKGGFGTGL